MLLTWNRERWMSKFEIQVFSPGKDSLKKLRDKQNATKLVFSWTEMQDQLVFSKPVPVQVSSSRLSTAAGPATGFFIAVKGSLTNSCPLGLWQPHKRGYSPKKGGDACKESRTWPKVFFCLTDTPSSLTRQYRGLGTHL